MYSSFLAIRGGGSTKAGKKKKCRKITATGPSKPLHYFFLCRKVDRSYTICSGANFDLNDEQKMSYVAIAGKCGEAREKLLAPSLMESNTLVAAFKFPSGDRLFDAQTICDSNLYHRSLRGERLSPLDHHRFC